jgi:hypothetical protein
MDTLLFGIVTVKTLLALSAILVGGYVALAITAYFINRHWYNMTH